METVAATFRLRYLRRLKPAATNYGLQWCFGIALPGTILKIEDYAESEHNPQLSNAIISSEKIRRPTNLG